MASSSAIIGPKAVTCSSTTIFRFPLLLLSARANSVFRIANSLYIQFSPSILFFRFSSFETFPLSFFFIFIVISFPVISRTYNDGCFCYVIECTIFHAKRNAFYFMNFEETGWLIWCEINGYSFVRLVDGN